MARYLERTSFRLGDDPKIDLTNSAYVVKSGSYISAIGKAKDGLDMLNRKMAMLREHRASTRVFCLAYCTNKWSVVTAETYRKLSEAESREDELWERRDNKLPYPHGKYDGCNNGRVLKLKLMRAAQNTPERGYIEAVFDIGEQLYRLAGRRFAHVWKEVGCPPGPWQRLFDSS